jgi:hypothetical protein
VTHFVGDYIRELVFGVGEREKASRNVGVAPRKGEGIGFGHLHDLERGGDIPSGGVGRDSSAHGSDVLGEGGGLDEADLACDLLGSLTPDLRLSLRRHEDDLAPPRDGIHGATPDGEKGEDERSAAPFSPG